MNGQELHGRNTVVNEVHTHAGRGGGVGGGFVSSGGDGGGCGDEHRCQ